jgi:hypothetical protein
VPALNALNRRARDDSTWLRHNAARGVFGADEKHVVDTVRHRRLLRRRFAGGLRLKVADTIERRLEPDAIVLQLGEWQFEERFDAPAQ